LDSKTKKVEKVSEETISKEEIIRAEVITTAQKLFQHYGLQKTTMEDIAKAIGRGKSTLYYYYKSKDEIFEAVVIKEANEVVNKVLDATKKASSAEEKLQAYLMTSFNTIKGKMNLYGVMKEELLNAEDFSFCPKTLREPIKQFNTREKQVVKDILLFGVESKEFTPDLKENIDLVAYVVITALRSISIDLAFHEKDLHSFFDEEKLNAIVIILLRGLKR